MPHRVYPLNTLTPLIQFDNLIGKPKNEKICGFQRFLTIQICISSGNGKKKRTDIFFKFFLIFFPIIYDAHKKARSKAGIFINRFGRARRWR